MMDRKEIDMLRRSGKYICRVFAVEHLLVVFLSPPFPCIFFRASRGCVGPVKDEHTASFAFHGSID